MTGRYCSDGPADSPGETVQESLPSPPTGNARRAAGRQVTPVYPSGVDIRCGGVKGQRCRGTFTLR